MPSCSSCIIVGFVILEYILLICTLSQPRNVVVFKIKLLLFILRALNTSINQISDILVHSGIFSWWVAIFLIGFALDVGKFWLVLGWFVRVLNLGRWLAGNDFGSVDVDGLALLIAFVQEGRHLFIFLLTLTLPKDVTSLWWITNQVFSWLSRRLIQGVLRSPQSAPLICLTVFVIRLVKQIRVDLAKSDDLGVINIHSSARRVSSSLSTVHISRYSGSRLATTTSVHVTVHLNILMELLALIFTITLPEISLAWREVFLLGSFIFAARRQLLVWRGLVWTDGGDNLSRGLNRTGWLVIFIMLICLDYGDVFLRGLWRIQILHNFFIIKCILIFVRLCIKFQLKAIIPPHLDLFRVYESLFVFSYNIISLLSWISN